VIARAGIQLPFSCIGFFCFTPGCRRIKTKTTGRDGSAINKEAKYTPRMNTNIDTTTMTVRLSKDEEALRRREDASVAKCVTTTAETSVSSKSLQSAESSFVFWELGRSGVPPTRGCSQGMGLGTVLIPIR